MAQREATRSAVAESENDVDAFSIDEFCRRHRISVQLFYKLRTEMPATFRIGTRVLISRESASAWRREREKAVNTPSYKK